MGYREINPGCPLWRSAEDSGSLGEKRHQFVPLAFEFGTYANDCTVDQHLGKLGIREPEHSP